MLTILRSLSSIRAAAHLRSHRVSSCALARHLIMAGFQRFIPVFAIVLIVLTVGAVLLATALRTGLIRAASGGALQRAAEVTASAARAPLPSLLPPVDASRRTLVQIVDEHVDRIAVLQAGPVQ